jgi:hypothetical protein
MGAPLKNTYDADFVEWTAQTAELLREGRFSELDLEHLAVEIEDLGKRDASAARSQLRRMLMHLIELRIQPERAGQSWRRSIAAARATIEDAIEDSPSLGPFLEANLEKTYSKAVRAALEETQQHARDAHIPTACPYTLDQLLTAELDALWLK